ncbi:MAG: TetR family transcriptional regulator [Myxococcales bacterium]|nr:TetR family transcriptional regulator [Myxococcales bacterium]
MAPRGLYQRGLSQAERWALHRSELIRATAEVLNERAALNVQNIVRRAGKGRNTFYAHFASLEQATRAVESSAAMMVAGRVEGALRHSVAPRERLRGVISGWLAAASESPDLIGAFLSSASSSRCAALARQQLRGALEDARSAGVFSGVVDEARLLAAVGSFQALVRIHVERRAAADAVERVALEVLLRLFR